jgi:hypothetical protein
MATTTNRLALSSRRTLRVALGTALCVALSFALDLPIPVIAPAFALFLLATQSRPLSFKAGIALALVVAATTGSGLLLVPLLRYYALGGVAIVALLLFIAFRYGLRGGNNLVATFFVAGVTMVSAAGTADFQFGTTVVGALVKGLLLALLVTGLVHLLFPEPARARPQPAAAPLSAPQAARIAVRAALVVMPAWLFAMSDPATYMPIIMKSVSLGRQSCTVTARNAARELVGSTLFGGLLAIALWFALRLFVHLWMFFLWTLLFVLLVEGTLNGIGRAWYSASFRLNSLVTMIILLGQSVQDSAAGKDVYSAFAVRMGLFLAVTIYAWLMLTLLDRRGVAENG